MLRYLLEFHTLEEAGAYVFYLSIVAPVFLYFGANFRFYAGNNLRGNDESIFAFRFLNFIIVSFICFMIWMLTPQSAIVAIVCSMKFIEFIYDSLQARELKQGLSINSFYFPIAYLILIMLIFVLSFYAGQSLIVYIAIVIFISSVLIYLIKFKELIKHSNASLLLHSFNRHREIYFSVGLPALIVALIALVPRAAIEKHAGMEYLAVFGSYIYVYVIIKLITQSIVLTGRNGRLGLMKQIATTLFICLVLLTFSSFNHSQISLLLFGPALADYSYYLPVFFGFITISSIASGLELRIIKESRTRKILHINILSLSLSLPCCFLLASSYGFNGVIAYLYIYATVQLILFSTLYRKVLLENETDTK